MKKVYIVKSNLDPSFRNDPILIMDKFNNLDIQWKNENEIDIGYSEANIYDFNNSWLLIENGKVVHKVEIALLKK